MIVDDDSAVQSAIRLVLEPAGHTIFVAGDGRKGLSIFEAENVDLVLLDIFMPGMDGLETMRLIQQRRPLIPIIVISGRPIASDAASGPDFLAMATRLGAAASLRKPFKRAALLAAIADCIEAAKRPSSSSLQADDTASGSDAKNKSPVRPSLRPGANPAPSEK